MSKYAQFEEKLKKAIDSLNNDLAVIRAGRANPAILDKVMVDYYGTPTPVKSIGGVSVPEPRIIQIQPWETSLLREIEKAILSANIGVTPTNDGKSIRLVFPELTQDRRKDLVKSVKKRGEESKVAIRNLRRDELDSYKTKKKNNEISEDELKGAENDIQKIIDKSIAQVDKILELKEKDIMEV